MIKALGRRKWIMIFSLIVGVCGSLVFSLIRKKTYASSAQYSTGLTQTQKVSLQLTEILDINQIDFRFNNVIETFKSPTVLGMLSYDLLLHDLVSPRPFRTLTEKQKKKKEYLEANVDKSKDILNQKLLTMQVLSTYEPEEKKVWDLMNLYGYDESSLSKQLTIERIQRSDYLSVQFTSENPELSAYVVNMIGQKFQEFYNLLTGTRTKASIDKLDSLARAKRLEVDSLRKKLQDFRTKIGTPNPGDAATAAMSGLQALESELTQQQARLNTLKAQRLTVIDQLSALNNTPQAAAAAVNNNDEILQLRRSNLDLGNQLAQKGDDPEIQARIDANQRKIASLSRAAGGSGSGSGTTPVKSLAERKDELFRQKLDLEADIASTNENIGLYQQRVDEFHKTAYSGGGKEVIQNAYESDLQTALKDLEKYQSSLLNSQNLDVAPDFNFRQTLPGQPPIQPEPAHTTLIVAISGLSMFFLACLFIIILEFLDTSLRTSSIFQKETKSKVLTVVNKIDLQRRSLKESFDLAGVANGLDKASSIFIEHLRKLRFELESSGKKTILVTSTKPGEGKSTIVEALAHTFSMSKKKVLLIDANFSNNTLTKKFSAKPTLEYFSLNGQDNAIDKIWGITTLTNIINTDIIGCNEGNYTPMEILPKNNLLMNLGKVAQHYDYILLEAAALNTHADSKELAKYVDGIITVFSARNSFGEIDKESMRFLKDTGDKFIGTVLNNVDENYLDL